MQQILVMSDRACLLVYTWPAFLQCPHQVERWGALWISEAWIPFMKAPPSWFNYLPSTITLGWGLLHIGLSWGHRHSRSVTGSMTYYTYFCDWQCQSLCMKVESHSVLSDSLRPMGYTVHGNSPVRRIHQVGSLSLFQRSSQPELGAGLLVAGRFSTSWASQGTVLDHNKLENS